MTKVEAHEVSEKVLELTNHYLVSMIQDLSKKVEGLAQAFNSHNHVGNLGSPTTTPIVAYEANEEK